jgi:hypothetical protein
MPITTGTHSGSLRSWKERYEARHRHHPDNNARRGHLYRDRLSVGTEDKGNKVYRDDDGRSNLKHGPSVVGETLAESPNF